MFAYQTKFDELSGKLADLLARIAHSIAPRVSYVPELRTLAACDHDWEGAQDSAGRFSAGCRKCGEVIRNLD
jgi:hypothetical protein